VYGGCLEEGNPEYAIAMCVRKGGNMCGVKIYRVN